MAPVTLKNVLLGYRVRILSLPPLPFNFVTRCVCVQPTNYGFVHYSVTHPIPVWGDALVHVGSLVEGRGAGGGVGPTTRPDKFVKTLLCFMAVQGNTSHMWSGNLFPFLRL